MSNRYFNGLVENDPGATKDQDNGQALPEELKGKSASEVYDLLKQEHSRVLEDETKNLKSQLYEFQQKGDSPETKQQPSQQQAQPQRQQQQQPSNYNYGYGGYDQQQQAPDIFTDPEGFLDQQFERRVAPLAQMTVDNLREVNKQSFQSRIGADEWKKYGSEIEQFVRSLAPQMQANPQAFETAYNLARSQHVDEIAEERATKQSDERTRRTLLALGYDEEQVEAALAAANGEQAPSSQGNSSPPRSLFQSDTGTVPTSQPPSSGASRGSGKKQPKLTRDQREAAQKFGMTEEEYADYSGLNTDMYSTMVEGMGNG